MRTTQLQLILASGVAVVGCVPDFGTSNVGLAALGIASVTSSTSTSTSTSTACPFNQGMPLVLSDAVVLDLAASETLRLPLVIRNDWNTTVSAKDFDLAWSCNALGFMNGVGPLYVPTFSFDTPFCQDTRDPNRPFVGFDVVAATGAPIEPGATGVIWVEVVPSALGQGMIESLELALLADACLDGQPFAADLSSANCQAFAARVDQVLPGATVTQSMIVNYASFANADGDFALGTSPAPPPLGSGYRMQIRGFLRAVSGSDDVFSNEIIQVVDVCRNCGAVAPTVPPTREARTGFECYYDPTTPR